MAICFIFDFIHAFGSGREALMYARLFWPEFVEFKDMVFLKLTLETEDDKHRVDEALKRYNNDPAETERSFNLVEIQNLFGRRTGETDDQEDRWLAEFIVEMWSCRLRTLFPKRFFKVDIVEPEETGGEIAVLFYQTN